MMSTPADTQHPEPEAAKLRERRKEAAIASGGISSGSIHKAALQALGQLRENETLLEYGAGTGDLLKVLEKLCQNARLVGADILPRPDGISADTQWIEADLNTRVDAPDGSFDVILSTEVIEHLENPRAVVREWWRLLKPGGRVVMTTPNNQSLRSQLSLLVNGHFVAFLDSCYPAHITALLECDLRRIFAETGFESPVFSYTNEGGIPKMPGLKWQKVSLGLLRGRLFSDNLVLSTRKPHGA